jgi:predicted ATPase
MIREVYVNGYRSLESIKIPLRAGLNILVGPNGGGKTNILSFFEFLSKLVEMPVDEAVSLHGGIGRVFSRLPENQFRSDFDARISGSINFRTKGGLAKTLHYTWAFSISASDSYEEIEYKAQTLYINLNIMPEKPENSDLILETRTSERGTTLHARRMVISRLQHFFRGISFVDVSTYYDSFQAQRFFEYYSRYNNLLKDSVFSAFPSQVTIFRQIIRDIQGGEIFNVVPEIVKQAEDSSKPPIMEKNGAGLASVLHRLGRPEKFNFLSRAASERRRRLELQKLAKIKSYLSLVSPSIMGLRTEKNPIDNTISVFIDIEERDCEVAFPLAQCSDGTVKWIALLTKVVTDNSGFSIEEPENFLHPLVQQEFLSVVRTEADHEGVSPYTLVTTHSETLLNRASPEEVLLVWMEEGKTQARRVANTESLIKAINETGFGLGHFYTTGALESA